MADGRKKIPYDVAPISRDYSKSESNRQYVPSKPRLTASLFIIAILVFNIVLGIITITTVARNGGTNVINLSQTISSSDGDGITYATSKAELSVVCIGVGGSDSSRNSFSQTNVPDSKEIFSNTSSRGSGIIFSIDKNDGVAYIVTCYHVVSTNTNAAFVLLYDSNQPVYATVLGTSTSNDIAVLKIQDNQLKNTICNAATFADSGMIRDSETAIAVGNPEGKGFASSAGTITRPIVEYYHRDIAATIRGVEVSTKINAGNSGGGLFDKNGNLIGMVQAKINSSDIDNVAYALPSNFVASLANNIIERRNLSYAPAGYTVNTTVNVKVVGGVNYRLKNVFVKAIDPSTGVDVAGKLVAGDQLLSITYQGKTVEIISEYTYEDIKYDLKTGDQITYRVKHTNGNTENVTITITQVTSSR
ncbi:MAG: serine protease [Clostridia bacterium]|nr:serine protease [Clostridia bacterium]